MCYQAPEKSVSEDSASRSEDKARRSEDSTRRSKDETSGSYDNDDDSGDVAAVTSPPRKPLHSSREHTDEICCIIKCLMSQTPSPLKLIEFIVLGPKNLDYKCSYFAALYCIDQTPIYFSTFPSSKTIRIRSVYFRNISIQFTSFSIPFLGFMKQVLRASLAPARTS